MKTIESAARQPRLAPSALAIAFGLCLLSVSGPGRAQTAVRDIDRPTREPFQTQLANQLIGETARLFPITGVPLGKRLVIEHASVNFVVAPTPTRQYHVSIFLRTQVNGEVVDHVLALDKRREQPSGNADVFEASQPIRVYADPGTTVSALVSFHTGSRSDGVDQANINRLSLSGYLVNER